MKARIALADPESVEMTMTVTMTLKDWKLLKTQTDQGARWHSPAGRLQTAIGDLVRRAEKHFAADGTEISPEVQP